MQNGRRQRSYARDHVRAEERNVDKRNFRTLMYGHFLLTGRVGFDVYLVFSKLARARFRQIGCLPICPCDPTWISGGTGRLSI